MPAIYADSFGGLGQADLAQQQLRQNALANSLSTAVAALSAARAHRLALDEFQYKQQQDTSLSRERGMDRTQRQDNSDREYALQEQYLKLAQETAAQKNDQPTTADVREHDLMFQQADNDATAGTFDNPDHVSKLYPKLTKQEALVLSQRSQQARQQISSDYNTVDNAAKVLNVHRLLTDRVYKLDQMGGQMQGAKPGVLPSALGAVGVGNTARIAGFVAGGGQDTLNEMASERSQLTDQIGRIAPLVDSIKSDKSMRNLVTFDAKSGRYLPALPKPRWMTSPVSTNTQSASTVTPATSTGTNAAPYDIGVDMVRTTRTVKSPTFEPAFYARVNDLISSGKSPADAKRQALIERQQNLLSK